MGRFLSQKDISAARHEAEAYNSALKRGEIQNADKIERLHHVVCGCWQEGCIFIHAQRRKEEADSPDSGTRS